MQYIKKEHPIKTNTFIFKNNNKKRTSMASPLNSITNTDSEIWPVANTVNNTGYVILYCHSNYTGSPSNC